MHPAAGQGAVGRPALKLLAGRSRHWATLVEIWDQLLETLLGEEPNFRELRTHEYKRTLATHRMMRDTLYDVEKTVRKEAGRA